VSDPLQTTYAVKQRTVWAAEQLMRKAGCDVIRKDTPNGTILTVTLPPDPDDIHGERLRAISSRPL